MRTRYFSKERLAKLVEVFPKATFDAEAEEPAFIVTAADFPAVLRALKEKEGFDRLGNLTAVDWKDRIEMVYHLYNMEENVKLEVKVSLEREAPVIESATALYAGAEFEEREVYDLMGVNFLHHPDLRRILMPDDYPAHPLRKDFVAPEPKLEGGKLVWLEKAPTS